MYNIFLINILLYFKTYSLLTTLFVFYTYIRTLLCASLCTKNYYSSNQVYKETLQLLSRQREPSLSKNCTFLCSARRGEHCSPLFSMFFQPPLHLGFHPGKSLRGVRVLGLEIQQLPQPALLGYGAQAFGVAQLKYKRNMPHGVIGRVVVQGAQYAVVLVKGVQHGRGRPGFAAALRC